MIECGSYSGYQRHIRSNETPCDDCRAANAEYQRDRRRNNPETYRAERRPTVIRNRALARLARLHPGEYARLYSEEKRRLWEIRRKDKHDG